MTECTECGAELHENASGCPTCNTEIPPLSPALIAVGAITGEFITEPGSVELNHRVGEPWPVNEEISFNLISEVEKKFKRKNKYHSYYEENTSSASPQRRLIRYINDELPLEQLANMFMSDLVSSAEDIGVTQVAGGNVVFMHYKTNGDENDLGRLLVIMANRKDGFDFDGNLVPTSSTHINLDALRQAALFDLTLFDSTYPNKPEQDTYLKFIKGNSTAQFFQRSFGCVVRADNKRSTEQLYEALDRFQQVNRLSESFYEQARASVERHLEEAARTKSPVSATTLYTAIESKLPDNSLLRGTFSSFVNERGFEINDHIEPTNQNIEAEKWVNISTADNSFSAKLYKQRIGGDGDGEDVEYNPETRILSVLVSDDRACRELERLIAANREEEESDGS